MSWELASWELESWELGSCELGSEELEAGERGALGSESWELATCELESWELGRSWSELEGARESERELERAGGSRRCRGDVSNTTQQRCVD